MTLIPPVSAAIPDLSVIIPVYNRGELIRYTLESVRRASEGLKVETVIVDDGSSQPAAEAITQLGYRPEKLIRQENQGLLFARLTGLAAATGRHTVFLDSDDLVSPDKFRLQVKALDETRAAVSYTDSARVMLEGDYDALDIQADAPCESTSDGPTFFIRVQPAPHSPVFRTDFLRRVVADACFPPSHLYNPVAEIWFYHNAAIHAEKAVKVPGPHTIVGMHPGARLTNHWERLAVASLAVMEAFVRGCPRTAATAAARQLVAEKAFHAWRRLPRGFSEQFTQRTLNLWRGLHQTTQLDQLGGRSFQTLASILGPVTAASLLKLAQNRRYASCQTMTENAFAELWTKIPPA